MIDPAKLLEASAAAAYASNLAMGQAAVVLAAVADARPDEIAIAGRLAQISADLTHAAGHLAQRAKELT
ncbi:MAG: hypothetical protein GY719_26270 [bacterium]|nr:hypothetical protein [bacterium]